MTHISDENLARLYNMLTKEQKSLPHNAGVKLTEDLLEARKTIGELNSQNRQLLVSQRDFYNLLLHYLGNIADTVLNTCEDEGLSLQNWVELGNLCDTINQTMSLMNDAVKTLNGQLENENRMKPV